MATSLDAAYQQGLRDGHKSAVTSSGLRGPTVPPSGAPGVPLLAASCDDLEGQVRARRDQMRQLNPQGRFPTDQSIATQFARLKTLHRYMFSTNPTCGDLEWCRDTDAVLDFIREHPQWRTESSKNAHRSALAAVLRNVLTFEQETKVYSQAVTAGRAVIQKEVGENELRGNAAENYLPWDQLVQKACEAKPGSLDSAIMAIYTFIPPRRLLDYSLMLVVRAPPDPKTLDPRRNYLVITSDGVPETFVFNRYKTASTFGQQILPVERHLVKVLKRYLERYEIPDNTPLFPHRRGGSHPNFSRVVSDVFRRHTGRSISVDLLRHAYITMYLDNRPTLNERSELARQMAHSLRQQAEYEVIQP